MNHTEQTAKNAEYLNQVAEEVARTGRKPVEYRVNGHTFKCDDSLVALRLFAAKLQIGLADPASQFDGTDEIAREYGLKVEQKKPTVRIMTEFQELPNDSDDPMPTPYDMYGGKGGFHTALRAVEMGVFEAPDAEEIDDMVLDKFSSKFLDDLCDDIILGDD